MKKTTWIILSIIFVLVAIRLALPYLIINYVNGTLKEIEGYTGSIQDVDLHLYRGAYQIDSLIIDKVENNNEIPFLSIPEIDISLEWSALFNGAFVGQIVLREPTLNFVAPNKDDGEFGQEVDWVKLIKDVNPFTINRFAVENGNIHFRDVGSDPQVNLPLHSLDLQVLNISNAEGLEEDLPTDIKLSATSIGEGSLSIMADAHLLKSIPDLDLNLEFENVNLPDLNDFLKAYAKIDAENGVFNLYTEIIVRDGQIDGYVKPILDRVKILSLEKEDGNALQVAWEGIMAFVSEAFENQKENQLATEVPLSGKVSNVETGVVQTIWNVFRNAFVEAFEKETGGNVSFDNKQEGN